MFFFLIRFETSGLQSSLAYVPVATEDFGFVECKAENSIGDQRRGCQYLILKKGIFRTSFEFFQNPKTKNIT